ncbi:MAG: hypothetical protein WDZ94_00360 [Patescibacteria group bacterium]
MPERRTKQQKAKAAQRRVASPGRAVASSAAGRQQTQASKDTEHSEKSLLRVDVQLHTYDLYRSVLMSLFIVAVLIGIFIYLSYN